MLGGQVVELEEEEEEGQENMQGLVCVKPAWPNMEPTNTTGELCMKDGLAEGAPLLQG